jgi:hypothetical protein
LSKLETAFVPWIPMLLISVLEAAVVLQSKTVTFAMSHSHRKRRPEDRLAALLDVGA